MLRARLGGYFWMPCPLCGEMFGGHEIGGYLMKNFCEGSAVCPNCKDRATEMNEKIIPGIRLIPDAEGFEVTIDSCNFNTENAYRQPEQYNEALD